MRSALKTNNESPQKEFLPAFDPRSVHFAVTSLLRYTRCSDQCFIRRGKVMKDSDSKRPPPVRRAASRQSVPSGESTRRLIARAQAGENEALDSLCARYLPRLYRLATGRLPAYLRGSVDTGDLVQDSLIRTVNNLGALRPHSAGAFPAYLRQVVLNRIREEVRKSASKPWLTTMKDNVAAVSPSPLEATIGGELVAQYEAALSRLKEDDRAVLFLKIEMDMNYAEIADALDKPSVDAARMAAKRAIVRLAGEMETTDAR
jgi:RNA polymerase sigma factor (sigma-70 family)